MSPELLAAACLLKLGSFPADPLEMLSRSPGVFVCTEEEAERFYGVTGFLRREEDARAMRGELDGGGLRWLIVLRSGADESRLRFTLAHELGHVALRHAEDSPANEEEAQRFAAALLVPQPLLTLLEKHAPLTPALAAAVFGVSRAMANTALKRAARPLPEETEKKLMEAFGEQALQRLAEVMKAAG